MADKGEYTIYAVINNANKKGYVGCCNSSDHYFSQRKANHLWQLRNDRHPNSDIQEDYNKYGEEAFDFCIKLETVYDTKENAMKEEQFWMDILQTKRPYGYNAVYDGYSHKEESKRKMKENATCYWTGKTGSNAANPTPIRHIPTGKEYGSLVDAANELGISRHSIGYHLCGDAKKPKFEYV